MMRKMQKKIRALLSVNAYARDASIRKNGNSDVCNWSVGIRNLVFGTFKNVFGIGRHTSTRNQCKPLGSIIVFLLRVIASFKHGTLWKVAAEMLGVYNNSNNTSVCFFAELDDGPVKQWDIQQLASSFFYQNSRTVWVSCCLPAYVISRT